MGYVGVKRRRVGETFPWVFDVRARRTTFQSVCSCAGCMESRSINLKALRRVHPARPVPSCSRISFSRYLVRWMEGYVLTVRTAAFPLPAPDLSFFTEACSRLPLQRLPAKPQTD